MELHNQKKDKLNEACHNCFTAAYGALGALDISVRSGVCAIRSKFFFIQTVCFCFMVPEKFHGTSFSAQQQQQQQEGGQQGRSCVPLLSRTICLPKRIISPFTIQSSMLGTNQFIHRFHQNHETVLVGTAILLPPLLNYLIWPFEPLAIL